MELRECLRRKGGTGAGTIFEDIMAENFPSLSKGMHRNIQKPQCMLRKMNSEKLTLRHIRIKILKGEGKEIILKEAREK